MCHMLFSHAIALLSTALLQCTSFACTTFSDLYSALPGRFSYEQQETNLWTGFSTLLGALGHGAMKAFLARHPEMRALCIRKVADMQQPGAGTTEACIALQCVHSMLKVILLHCV
jgi:hypothetical protein